MTATVLAGNGPITGTGTNINRVKTAANSTSQILPSGTFDAEVTGARHRLLLTESSTLVVARFTATSDCTGGPGVCEIEIIVVNNDTTALAGFMQPGGDPPFDATGSDGLESHTTERSITLPAGDYDFFVKMSSAPSPNPTFTLHSWHFTVERIV